MNFTGERFNMHEDSKIFVFPPYIFTEYFIEEWVMDPMFEFREYIKLMSNMKIDGLVKSRKKAICTISPIMISNSYTV